MLLAAIGEEGIKRRSALFQVRESFVRQFMLETGEDEDNLISKCSGDDENKNNSKVLYRKKQPLRLLNSVNCTCIDGTALKQNAITAIIK